MPKQIHCTACDTTFSISSQLYEKYFANKISTIKCKRCGTQITVDATGPTPVTSAASKAKNSPKEHKRASIVPRPGDIKAPRPLGSSGRPARSPGIGKATQLGIAPPPARSPRPKPKAPPSISTQNQPAVKAKPRPKLQGTMVGLAPPPGAEEARRKLGLEPIGQARPEPASPKMGAGPLPPTPGTGFASSGVSEAPLDDSLELEELPLDEPLDFAPAPKTQESAGVSLAQTQLEPVTNMVSSAEPVLPEAEEPKEAPQLDFAQTALAQPAPSFDDVKTSDPLLDDPDPTPFETPLAMARASNPELNAVRPGLEEAEPSMAILEEAEPPEASLSETLASQADPAPMPGPDFAVGAVEADASPTPPSGTNPDLKPSSYEVSQKSGSGRLRRPLLMAAAVLTLSAIGAVVFWTQSKGIPLAALLKGDINQHVFVTPGEVPKSANAAEAAGAKPQEATPDEAAKEQAAEDKAAEDKAQPPKEQAAADDATNDAPQDEAAKPPTDDEVAADDEKAEEAQAGKPEPEEAPAAKQDEAEADGLVAPAAAEVPKPASWEIPSSVYAPGVEYLINQAMKRARNCHRGGRTTGTTRVQITFSQDGKVSDAELMDEPLKSARVGKCVKAQALGIKIPAFEDEPFSVETSITLR